MYKMTLHATFTQHYRLEEDYVDPVDWVPFYIEDYWAVLSGYQPIDEEVPHEYQTSHSE